MDDNAIESERLRRAVADVDAQHQEAMRPVLPEGDDGVAVANRRQFLKRATLGGAVLAAGAGTISVAALRPAAAQSTTATESITDGDTPTIVFAQTAELALVSLYQTAIQTDKLSPILTETARTFGLHHTDHATVLATIADKAATNTANAALIAQYEPQIRDAANEDAVVQVLYQLEQATAATYESALGKLETTFTAGPVSTIMPIEGQHAVVWGQILDLPSDQWLPAFQSESDALDPQKYAS